MLNFHTLSERCLENAFATLPVLYLDNVMSHGFLSEKENILAEYLVNTS